MNQLILITPYTVHFFDERYKIYNYNYLSYSAQMTEDEFKESINQIIELSEEHKPLYILSNRTEFHFDISIDLQRWTVSKIVTAWSGLGIKRYAQVLPKYYHNDITELSIMANTKEKLDFSFEVKFFKNEEEALTWLLEENKISYQEK